MRLVRPALVALTTTLLVAATLATAPAFALPDANRDGHHFPVSVETTVPAGGTSMITTPALGKQVDMIKVAVRPQADATEAQKDEFDELTSTMGKLTKGGKLLVCVMLYYGIASTGNDEPTDVSINAMYSSIAFAILGACLRMAGLIAQNKAVAGRQVGPPARAARACDRATPRVPATVEKTDEGYTLTAEGTTQKAKKPPLRVGCRVRAGKVIFKVRAAEKGVPLRRVVGKRFNVGILSPADADTAVPVKVTFALP